MIELQSTIRTIVGLVGLSLACSGARAADPLYSVLDMSAENPRLTFAHCPEDDSWQECVSHYLECKRESPQQLFFVIWGEERRGPDARKIAKSLLDTPWGQTSFTLLPAGQSKTDMLIYALEVTTSELNGDWDLTLKTYDSKPFFEAVGGSNADGAKIEVAGVQFSLTPHAGDHKKLLDFAKACQ
jgi:hypothetical protein